MIVGICRWRVAFQSGTLQLDLVVVAIVTPTAAVLPMEMVTRVMTAWTMCLPSWIVISRDCLGHRKVREGEVVVVLGGEVFGRRGAVQVQVLQGAVERMVDRAPLGGGLRHDEGRWIGSETIKMRTEPNETVYCQMQIIPIPVHPHHPVAVRTPTQCFLRIHP